MKSKSHSFFCLLSLVTLANTGMVSADVITWNNPTGGDWDVPANWSPQQVPGASDRAVVDGTASFTIQMAGSQSVSELVMDNPNATLRMVANSTVGHSWLTVANPFENRGTIEFSSVDSEVWGAFLTVTTGTLLNAADGVLRVLQGTGGARLINAELDNRGTLEVGGNLELLAGGNHRNSGQVSIATGARMSVNAGTWIHQGGSITGAGTIVFNNTTLNLEADFTATVSGMEGSPLIVNGPGRFILPPGPAFTLRSGWTFNADIDNNRDLVVDAAVAINGGFGVPAGRTLRIVANSTAGHASLTVANPFENRGTIELTSVDSEVWGAFLILNTGTLLNAPGGVLRVLQGTGGGRVLDAELDNRGTLEVGGNLELLAGGNHRNSGQVSIATGARMSVNAGTWIHQGGSITGAGTIVFNNTTLNLEADFTATVSGMEGSPLIVNGPGRFILPPGPAFTLRSGWTFNADIDNNRDLVVDAAVAINGGFGVPAGRTLRIVANSTAGHASLTVANPFENRGTIELTSVDSEVWGAFLILNTGTLLNAPGGVLRVLQGTGGGRVLDAELDNRGTLEVGWNLQLLPGANHRNSGLVEVTAGTTTVSAGSFSNQGETRVMAGATLVLSGAALANSATGLLSGAGTFDLSGTSAATNVGVVAPGVSSGTLTVTGDYPQSAGGRLQLEIGGFTPTTQYDRLIVSGQALLGGLVRATLVNGFLPKKDDAFTVLTYASRNGSFTAVQSAEPERIAWRMQYGATSAQLIVANTAPTLAAIANQTVNEETVLSLTPTATDQDLPPQTFTYSLTTAPAGMTINPSSGLITWTPAEAQGPGVHNVTVRVTDTGTPALGHTTSFSVTVNEVNLAPVLPALPDATIHAGTTFTASLSATDSDLPANTLTYSLPTGPSDATLSPAGVVSWSAPVTAAGTVADFTVSVTDNGLPTASVNRSFQVQVTGRLEILSSVQTGAQLEITWRAIPGRIYRLIASDTLPATEWTPVPGDIEATGATATKTIPIGALAGGNYFRVELVGE